MKHPVLIAEVRKILGKKVKQLRRDGLMPANVYGKGLDSIALQVKLSDFESVFKEVGTTGLVELKVGDKKRPVLVKNLQKDYFKDLPLHADFYQVNLKEKVKSQVPLQLIGEARAVREKIGDLLQTISEIEIEALPDRIPEYIEVNVEDLGEIGAGITVGDLKIEEGVEVLTDAAVIIARIAEPAKEEPVEAPVESGTEGQVETGGKASGSDSTSGEDKKG